MPKMWENKNENMKTNKTIMMLIISAIMLLSLSSVLADIGETKDTVIFWESGQFFAITFGAQECLNKQGSCYTKVDGTSYILMQCVQGTMSDGRPKCTCEYGSSCNPSSSTCTNMNLRCLGNMRQWCNQGVWTDTGACPSGLTCTLVSTSSLECRGTTTAVCVDNVYRCLSQKQQYCKNGQWVDLGVSCPDTTVCQGGGYNEYPICKNKDYLTNDCSYDWQCGSGKECIDTNLGRRCITCTYDNACDPYCDADPDCAEIPVVTPPTTPPTTTPPDGGSGQAGIGGISYTYLIVIIILVIIVLGLLMWRFKK